MNLYILDCQTFEKYLKGNKGMEINMGKYNILHLFQTEKFTDGFVDFINQNFSTDEHQFVIYGRKRINNALEIKCMKYENVKYITDIKNYLSRKKNVHQLKKYDKIIIHNLFNYDIINVCIKYKDIRSKTYIYLWGGDFYPCDLNEKGLDLWKRKKLIKNAAGIINILPEENVIVKKLYHTKGKLYNAQYYNEKEYFYRTKKEYIDTTNDNVLKIQIGNSASVTNNHIYILDILSKYKNENIEIYVPLSYGDKKYAAEIQKYGTKIFGDKFIAIKEFMSLEKYYEFMYSMDIAIFAMRRQQAVGNIEAHLYFGNKVYLNEKSVLAFHYKNTVGCKIGYIEDLNIASFEKFSHIDINEKINNIDKIKNYTNKKSIIARWKKIFES